MANKIVLKKSAVTGKVPLPADLEYGELALNYADGKLYYKNIGNVVSEIGNKSRLVTSNTTANTLASFPIANYGSAEILIQASQGTSRQITKLLVVHNGTTADATEYGTIQTADKLFSTEVDINASNLRVLVTSTTATSTSYVAAMTLLEV